MLAEYNNQSKKQWLFPAKPNDLNGFDKGYKVKTILGATDVNGFIEFVVQWQNNEIEVIHCKLAYEKCPQEIIDFYEKNCTWHIMCNDKSPKDQ